MLCRKLFSLVTREYGYKGKEIAGHIWKDPAVVTKYLKKKEELGVAVKKIIERIRANLNRQA